MKKLGFIVMPLMDISLLASCGGSKPSVDQFTVTFDATDGEFPIVGKTTSLKVDPNESLVLAIRAIVSPIKDGTKFAYFTYSDGTNISYGDKVTGDITLKAKYIKSTLEELSWNEIKLIAIGGHPRDYFYIGETKKVQLVQQDSKDDGADVISDGELYQTVRIIGIDEDCTNINHPDKTRIGLTFEFANSISDSEGYSLGTQWNDTDDQATSNTNYSNSSIRYALNKETGAGGCDHILWSKVGDDAWTNDEMYVDKSVIEMLPEKLTKVLTAPYKTVPCFENDTWIEKPIINSDGEYDKLFLLSPEEMGNEINQDGAYTYYQESDGTTLRHLRVKKQITNNVLINSPTWMPYNSESGQIYTLGVNNFAGFNPNIDAGGYLWTRSPKIAEIERSVHHVDPGGNVGHYFTTSSPSAAYAIAPAFCI